MVEVDAHRMFEDGFRFYLSVNEVYLTGGVSLEACILQEENAMNDPNQKNRLETVRGKGGIPPEYLLRATSIHDGQDLTPFETPRLLKTSKGWQPEGTTRKVAEVELTPEEAKRVQDRIAFTVEDAEADAEEDRRQRRKARFADQPEERTFERGPPESAQPCEPSPAPAAGASSSAASSSASSSLVSAGPFWKILARAASMREAPCR